MSSQSVLSDVSYSVAQVAPRELFPSVVEKVFDRLESIANDDGLYERGEVRPAPATVEWARRVLLRVIPRYYLRTAEIDVFHGEIHVNWERGNKRMVAYLPASGVLKVYLERIGENGNVEHVLHSNLQPLELNQFLKWLFS